VRGARPASRLDRYLAGLPAGLDSYPSCQAKGSIFRAMVEGTGLEPGALPAPLRPLVVEPPIPSDWLPEAHLGALLLAAADRLGLDDQRFFAWARARNRALFEGTLYRALMALVSPERLARFAPMRWRAFHRGTSLELGRVDDEGLRARISFPPGLFDGQLLIAYTAAFAAALDAAGAREVDVAIEEIAATSAVYRARWS
jgi:hypothetical protein